MKRYIDEFNSICSQSNLTYLMVERLKGKLVVFDIDGTLCDYRFGGNRAECTQTGDGIHILNVCSDSEFKDYCKEHNPYEHARPIDAFKKIIDKLDRSDVYSCSVAYSEKEKEYKKRFVNKHFGIGRDNCMFVGNTSQKVDILKRLVKETGKTVVLVDDTINTLSDIEDMNLENIEVWHTSSFIY